MLRTSIGLQAHKCHQHDCKDSHKTFGFQITTLHAKLYNLESNGFCQRKIIDEIFPFGKRILEFLHKKEITGNPLQDGLREDF